MRSLRKHFAILAIVLISVGGPMLAFRHLPFLAMMNNWVGDFALASLLPPQEQHKEIVVAAITEDTLRLFPYRSPVDRQFLSGLITILEAKGAKALAVDLLFDQPTEGEKDQALKEVLGKSKIPLVVSYATEEEGLSPAQIAYMREMLRPDQRGLANLVKDETDGTVRWIFSNKEIAEEGKVKGLVGQLAEKLDIPVPNKDVPINWLGSPDKNTRPFLTFPAHAAAFIPKLWIENKIVLIGADLTLIDRHRTPFSTVLEGPEKYMPGIMIHAHALASLMDKSYETKNINHVWEVIFIVITALCGVAIAKIDTSFVARIIVASLVLLGIWVLGFFIYRNSGIYLPIVVASFSLASALWLSEIYFSRQERLQKKFIKNAFAQYVSPHIVEELVRNPQSLALGGSRKEITCLFTDVAGFTTLSEGLDPANVGEILNQYFAGMCKIIMKYDGTIGDFIGDAIFAFFGAPLEQKDHAQIAVKCGLELAELSEEFALQQKAQGIDFGITRIGIHSGLAVVGNLGSEYRFKYSALGDVVNTASRIEGLNKYFGTKLCVTVDTLQQCRGFISRPLGRIVLKGRHEATAVVEVMAKPLSYIDEYKEAYSMLEKGRVADSRLILERIAQEYPLDSCVHFHLRRLREGVGDTLIVMKDK